jgi:hypothetical protein
MARVPLGESARFFALDPDHVGIETLDDAAGQIAWSHHWIEADACLLRQAPYRYVRPSELDLMARIHRFAAPRPLGRAGRGAVHLRRQSQVAAFEKLP